MIPASDTWGPFARGLDPAERTACLRCLRAIVHLTAGPRGAALVALLRRAEQDPTALAPAITALNALASLDRRHVLASYATLNRPS